MLKRLLATSLILAVLACAATVGLEAVGLLFHFGQPESAQRADAFFAAIVEEDPGKVPSEMEPDLPQPAVDAESKGRDVQDLAGHDGHADERPEEVRLAGAVEDKPGQDASAKVEAAAPRPEVAREPPPPPVQELPKSQSGGPQAPPLRLAKTERGKPVHNTARGYRSLGWPVLDWLDAALAPAPASDAGPGPAGRRAPL